MLKEELERIWREEPAGFMKKFKGRNKLHAYKIAYIPFKRVYGEEVSYVVYGKDAQDARMNASKVMYKKTRFSEEYNEWEVKVSLLQN